MLSSLVLLVYLFALGATATRDLWLVGLPSCWQSCLSSTEDGCSSSKCVCKTTQSSASYLPSAVSCAVMQCRADEWALEMVLGSLELYCAAINWPIPDDVVDRAYAAVTDHGLQSMSIAKPSTTAKPPAPKTTQGSSDQQAVTSTYRTTLTQTTLDSNGNTVQIIVPIVLGPTGYSTGSVITSTVGRRTTSTTVSPSSAAASPRSTAPSSTAPPQESPSTSSARPTSTRSPANGNGSPFENMQAGASGRGSWASSGLLQLLGVFVGLFMRL